MRKIARRGFLIPFFTGACISIYCFSQAQSVAGLTLKNFDKDSPPEQQVNNSVALKDAINQVKKFYKIKIAYREGLLEGKTVSASLLNDLKAYNAESALKL